MKTLYPDLDFTGAKLRSIPLPYSENSTSMFACIRSLPWAMYLDSCQQSSQRYDIMTADPLYNFVTREDMTQISNQKQVVTLSAQNPFDIINQLYQAFALDLPDGPFRGGFLGYFAYDLARRCEDLPTEAAVNVECPDMAIGLYDWSIVFDHQEKTCTLYWLQIVDDKDARWQTIMDHLQLEKVKTGKFRVTSSIKSNMTSLQYRDAFDKIKDHLGKGDCYQVNLTQQFSCGYEGDTWRLYKTLRKANPMPFSAYCQLPFADVLSISPERFIECRDQKVETKPIKGTRPRGATPEDDQIFIDELLSCEKERAENTMIVDLMRNDIGKCCKPGTVEVPKLCDLESYDSVHHLVSTVVGELEDDKTPVDLLEACFPGGSITGAPKISAMSIIEQVEPCRRNVYCGSIGYLDLGGRLDTNIAIRTILAKDEKLTFSAGGGIVYDSIPEAEYEESFTKISIIKKTLLLNQL